jgi:hypothetical protein
MQVCICLSPPDWKVHPRQNLPDNVLPTQDALVCEESKFAALRVVGHTTSRVLLVFRARHSSHFDQLAPVFVVTALVDQVMTIVLSPRERRGINEKLVADEKYDADFGYGWRRVLPLLGCPLLLRYLYHPISSPM